jgi:hypothetical protein
MHLHDHFILECYENDTTYYGSKVRFVRKVKSAEACQDLCAKEDRCNYFVWVDTSATTAKEYCYLKTKSSVERRKTFKDRVRKKRLLKKFIICSKDNELVLVCVFRLLGPSFVLDAFLLAKVSAII